MVLVWVTRILLGRSVNTRGGKCDGVGTWVGFLVFLGYILGRSFHGREAVVQEL